MGVTTDYYTFKHLPRCFPTANKVRLINKNAHLNYRFKVVVGGGADATPMSF